MKDFLFVYRTNYEAMPQASPEEMQALTKRWMDWIGSIAAQNKLVDRGNRLQHSGKVVKSGNIISDGPVDIGPFSFLIDGFNQTFFNKGDVGTDLSPAQPGLAGTQPLLFEMF